MSAYEDATHAAVSAAIFELMESMEPGAWRVAASTWDNTPSSAQGALVACNCAKLILIEASDDGRFRYKLSAAGEVLRFDRQGIARAIGDGKDAPHVIGRWKSGGQPVADDALNFREDEWLPLDWEAVVAKNAVRMQLQDNVADGLVELKWRHEFSCSTGTIVYEVGVTKNFLPLLTAWQTAKREEHGCDPVVTVVAGQLTPLGGCLQRGEEPPQLLKLQGGFRVLAKWSLTGQAENKPAKAKRKTGAEYDRECDAFLRAECADGRQPGPTDVVAKLGCGVKTVYTLPSFKAYWAKIKGGAKPKAVTLTKGMEAVASKDDGELARLVKEQRRDDRTDRVNSHERM